MNAVQKCIKQLEKSEGMSINEIDEMTEMMIAYANERPGIMFVSDGLDISGRHINARLVKAAEMSH